ncbi:MAG TPA: hypothetical protein VEK82_16630, partial [Stellaceae bacterium]|nr:hypothetical protein [Stellaceae bacterium]
GASIAGRVSNIKKKQTDHAARPLTLQNAIGRVFSVDFLIFTKTRVSLHRLSTITGGRRDTRVALDLASVAAKQSL